jgi:type I restriction enzyme S subunit
MKWPKHLAGELFDIQLGKMLSEKARTGDQLPYIANFNVRWGRFDLSELNQMGFSKREQEKFSIQPNDLLMCEGGEIGRCAVWTDPSCSLFYQKALHRLRARDERISPLFMYFYMQHISTKGDLPKLVGDTSIAHLTREKLMDLPVPTPPRAVQDEIVNVLLAWESAIEKTEQLIAAKEVSRRGLMQQLVMGATYPEYRLSEFVHRVARKNTTGNDHPLTISGRDGLISQSHYFDKRIAAESTEHYTRIQRGEFAYNKSYSAGYPYGAIKRLDAYDEGIVSSLYLCFAIKPDAPLLSDYLVHFCEVGGFNHQIHKIAQEGARNHGLLNVAADDFFAMKLSLPPVDEQARVAAILGNAGRELALLRASLEQLRRQKRGLMQKLLTGQWRLPIQEEAS